MSEMVLTREFARKLMADHYHQVLGMNELMADMLVDVQVKADTDGLVLAAYKKGYESARLDTILKGVEI